MTPDESRLGLGRRCPGCGFRADTLGTVCPACGRPYGGRGGLLERLPFMDDGVATQSAYGMRLLLAVVLALAVGYVVLLVKHPVAGILVGAAAFVLLVAAIGISNALNERGR